MKVSEDCKATFADLEGWLACEDNALGFEMASVISVSCGKFDPSRLALESFSCILPLNWRNILVWYLSTFD